MTWQYTPYALPLLVAAAGSVVLALYAWQRRKTAGARAVALLLLAVSVWSTGYALEFSAVTLDAKVLWAKVEYVGIVAVPVAWLAFALRYTGRQRWLGRGHVALLALVPVITHSLTVTNETHGIMWRRTSLDHSGVFLLIEHGPWFWVHSVYSYVLVALGTCFVALMLLRAPDLYRGQAWVLLVGATIPWVANVLYLAGPYALSHLDLTPFAFLLSGAVFSWGLFRYRLLDIAPVARDVVIDRMPHGVITVDSRGRVVDLNPAARRILDYPTSEVVGKALASVAPGLVAHLESCEAAETERREVAIGEGDDVRTYDLTLAPLWSGGGGRPGCVLMLHDITARKRAEARLREAESRYRSLVERMPAVTYLQEVGGPGTAMYVSPQVQALTGYSPEECRDPELRWSMVHPDDRERVRAEAERTGESGEVFGS